MSLSPVTPATADAAALIVSNLERLLTEYCAELELEQDEARAILATSSLLGRHGLEQILGGTHWPCPRTLSRLATALGTDSDHLLMEPASHEPTAERAG